MRRVPLAARLPVPSATQAAQWGRRPRRPGGSEVDLRQPENLMDRGSGPGSKQVTVPDTPVASQRTTRRVRLAAIVAVSMVALSCLIWLLLPTIDSHPVPSSVVKVKAALVDYHTQHSRYPRDFAEIEPYLIKRFPGTKCAVQRTGENEYRISVDRTNASYRFRVQYRLDDDDHVEVFEVRLD